MIKMGLFHKHKWRKVGELELRGTMNTFFGSKPFEDYLDLFRCKDCKQFNAEFRYHKNKGIPEDLFFRAIDEYKKANRGKKKIGFGKAVVFIANENQEIPLIEPDVIDIRGMSKEQIKEQGYLE